MHIGALALGNSRYEFVVWAPLLDDVTLKIVSPKENLLPMEKDIRGYWKVMAEGIAPGTLYYYRLNGGKDRPDPASFYQPQGVHGPSCVVDHTSFNWEDDGWKGLPLREMIMYEIHTGTFTPEGTFDTIIPRLDDLSDTGINAIEIMPVSQFPGDRNWGYDGTYPFAVQYSYGGPEGLKRLVNEAHRKGMAVILDVVYNHLGPEGNYLRDFAPYFTDKYRTPWGEAINFDDAYSNDVRNYFIKNALSWFGNYHIDALRLDAIHGITDLSARPFLEELAKAAEGFSARRGRKFYLIAESDLNDARVIRDRASGGSGIDAQWSDDFHHCLHTLLTGEDDGYYADFGKLEQLAVSIREGFVYSGQYSAYRKRDQGNSPADIPAERFAVFSQNHDQTGNRMLGERLSGLVPFEAQKLAAGTVLLSPFVPLLFMGEEYGEVSPFLYFISHSDPDLISAVREGRKREFRRFAWKGDPPDPQDEITFLRSKLNWQSRAHEPHGVMLGLYKHLIRLRKSTPALSVNGKKNLIAAAREEEKLLIMRRWENDSDALCLFNFSGSDTVFRQAAIFAAVERPVQSRGIWKKVFDSSATIWNGRGALLPDRLPGADEGAMRGHSFVVYIKEGD